MSALDLFETGLYLRKPGGNVERPELHALVPTRWAALNIGGDVGRDPTVWANQQSIYKAAGIPVGPWLHCRTLGDIDFLIDVGLGWGAPFIGFNIENVQEDFVDKGIGMHDVAARLARWTGPVHLPTLPWVQNGQSWSLFARCVVALEIFADEQLNTFPSGRPDPQTVEQCIGHAFEEGLTKVTLMLKTKAPWTNADYPHYSRSLFTADDITPLPELWRTWADPANLRRPQPPAPPPKPPPPKPPPDDRPVVLTEKQVPYTGPYFGPGNSKGPSKGPTAIALKRAMVRMGLLQADLSQLDEVYGLRLEAAIHYFQVMLDDVAATGQYGRGTWDGIRAAKVPKGRPNAGKPALDKLAQELIQREWKADQVADAPITKVRNAITDFCVRAEAHEEKWTYTQRRPYTGLGVAPENAHGNDCSSYVVLAYYWAREETGVLVPDPAGFAYNGYGNTWDKLDDHDHVSGTYLVGDLACYDGHVTLCRKQGDFRSAIWSSFGREAGPEDVSLYYRDDLRFVCRPTLV